MSPFWLTLIIWAVVFTVAELLRPKPNYEDARPAGLGDFRFPTATEGRAVPIVWGTTKIEAPNIVWYGNLRIRPVTEDIKTGMFSSDDVVTGYLYYVGIQFAICRGPVDSCNAVWVQDKIASGGRVGSGLMSVQADLGGARGAGTLEGSGQFYAGSKTEAANTYLGTHQSPLPAYRGTCYYVFEDGLVGTSQNIGPWAFEITRIPDGLNLASASPGSEAVNTWDANPMNVIYEILTDTDWGLKISSASIDTASFIAAGITLAAEGNGFSMTLDSEIEAKDLLREIERQIDGVLFFDREDGLWKIKLARDDYVPASLPLLDETNVTRVENFARATWEETTNQIRLLFSDKGDNWKQTYALAQDIANIEIQGGNISGDVSYPGVKNRTLANSLAWRELATVSYPLAKGALLVNREGFSLKPGDVFRWSCAALGISEEIYRISRFDFGKLEEGKIKISIVEDIFSVGVPVFGDPSPSGWTGEALPPTAFTANDTLIFEAPQHLLLQDFYDRQLVPRAWVGARYPGGGTIGFQLYGRYGTAQPVAGAYDPDVVVNTLLLAGNLNTALAAYGSSAVRPATDYNIIVDDDDPDSLTTLEVESSVASVQNLRQILYIDGEFIGFEIVEDQGGSIFHVKNLYRGLFHTAPKAHAAGSRVWFIGQTGGSLSRNPILDSQDEADYKLRAKSVDEIVSEALTVEEELSFERVDLFPLAPRDPEVNTNYAPSSEDIDTDYSTETGLSGADALGMEVLVTPRSWRKAEYVLDDLLYSDEEEAEWLEDSPEFDFSLVLDPSGTPATTAVVTHVATARDTVADYILRNAVIEALGANRVIPGTGRIRVTARHTPKEGATVYTNSLPLEHDLTITSALQGNDDLVFGGFAASPSTSSAVVFGETGNYSFDIKTALPSSGILEASVNGGGFVTVVAASATVGTLAITANDSVVLRASQAPAADQFFDITGPIAEMGYGVLLA